jgi:hypothetical protein
MITITNEFASLGRNLGNKLFTYAVGRIIAEKLNYKLLLPDNCKIQRNGIVEDFPYYSVNGNAINESDFYVCDRLMSEKGIDFVIENGDGKKIFLDGYFLKYDYIKQYKRNVKEYYKNLILKNDQKKDVVILLRDSNCDGTFKLPDHYYIDILDKLDFNDLYVSYDHFEKHKTLFDYLNKKYNPIFLDMNILDLFKFITQKNTIIASQGTFSFWSCLLSNASKIYWPISDIGPNLPSWCINLTVDDEDRYEKIIL